MELSVYCKNGKKIPEDELIPYPKDKKGTIDVYNEISGRILTGKKHVIPYTGECEKLEDPDITRINSRLFLKSNNQISEACNKLWSTLELYYHLFSNEKHFQDFKRTFISSSTISTLYYSAFSTMISGLHFFGVGLGRKRTLNDNRRFNYIRTEEGFNVVRRKQFEHSLLGGGGLGHHKGIFKTYKVLSEKGVELPSLDIDKFQELKKARQECDYRLLSDTSMSRVMRDNRFFELVPFVVDGIEEVINLINQTSCGDQKYVSNRFKCIKENIQEIYDKHDKYVL